MSLRIEHRRLALPILRIAEKQDLVRNDRFARGEILEAPCRPDLVALKNPGIALDRLHQRAGFTLLGGAAFAEAAAAQSGPKLGDRLRRRRKIMGGVEVGVQRQIGFDALEARDHAGQRADIFAEAGDGGARRQGAVAAAGHDQLAAGGKLDRLRRAARIAQFLAAAGRTLRAGGDVMFRDGRARQVEADDVIVQFGAEIGGDRLRDLDGCKLDGALSDRLPRQRRNRDTARLAAFEQRLDLPVPFHAVGKTHPTRTVARGEYRSHQREHAGGLGEQPRRLIGQMLAVEFGQPAVEIIAHQGDRQIGGALDHANAHSVRASASSAAPSTSIDLNAHAHFLQGFFRGLRQQTKARPIGRGGARRTVREGGRRSGGRPAASSLLGFCRSGKSRSSLRTSSRKLLPPPISAASAQNSSTVKKKLPVFGIEAHHIGRQHIDAEIRRELRNIFAVVMRKGLAASACATAARTPLCLSPPVWITIARQCSSVANALGRRVRRQATNAPAFLDEAKRHIRRHARHTPRIPPRRQWS